VIDGGVPVIDHAGTQIVSGEQALRLVRARHVAGDPAGDLGRIARQQQVLTALLAQAVGSGLLLDPQRLDRTLQVVVANTATDNVTVDDLANLAQSLRGTGSGQVAFHTLPTVPDPGSEFLLPADGDAAIFDALVNDREYPTAPGS
jgi:anionic cell wall polymer biosynthesis LytR-Cps2A-Psr (LCP) family protein